MADFNRNDRNDFGRRSGNLYDRYATERYDRDNTRMNNRERYEWERERYNTGPHNDDTGRPLTGDWRDDERRSRGEGDNDRGFFERAADTVSSWFSGDDDDRRDESPRTRADREREEYYERRYSTEGRGTLGHDRDWNSNFDTRYGAGMEENRHTHTNQDDTWRRDYNNTASFRNEAESSRRYGSQDSNRNYPERFSRDREDGREAGRDYYNRMNDSLRAGASNASRSPNSTGSSQYGSYGRTGSQSSDTSRYGSDTSRYGSDTSRYGSSPRSSGSTYSGSGYGSSSYSTPNYGSSSNSGSSWSNQSGTYGDNSGSYGSASRGQYAGRGPKGWRRSDDRVKEDVCEYLERNAMIDASDVDITVAEGVVTLTGTVPDRQMKRMCEDEIEHLPGVKDVNNQLRVNREENSDRDSSLRIGSSMSPNSLSNSSNDGSTSASASSSNGSNGSTGTNGSSRSDSSSATGSGSNTSNTRKSGSGVS